jgi:hypothetical protein
MPNKSIRVTVTAAVAVVLFLASTEGRSQVERAVQAEDDSAYGGKFFDQLRAIFGRFRTTDLERAFQTATSVRCSELVSNRGEWRPVAFFNENRKLGDWYRASIEEVRTDLVVYIFKGACAGDKAPLQLTTKFPIDESVDAYNAGRIPFERIDVNVNPPVTAVYDLRTDSYTFELPFLFLRERNDSGNIYSLIAPRVGERYARDVTDHWDCKSVSAEDVTYQFLICRTSLIDRDPAARNQRRTSSFGSSAFFILSDGKEATSSVKLSFGGDDVIDSPATRPDLPEAPQRSRPTELANAPAPTPDRRNPDPAPASAGPWRIPDFWSKLGDLEATEFRLQFSPQTWTGKIGSPQLLIDQKMSTSDRNAAPSGMSDYCLWKPASTRAIDRLMNPDPDSLTAYTVSTQPKNGQTPPSVTFALKTFTGLQLGDLQCFFPRAEAPSSISFDRWIEIVGAHITIEIRK